MTGSSDPSPPPIRPLWKSSGRVRGLPDMLAKLPGMVYVCTYPDLVMEYISEGAREVTGYAASEFKPFGTVSYLDLVSQEDLAPVTAVIQDALGRDTQFTVSYRIRDKDGKRRVVWDCGQGVRHPDAPDRIVAIHGICIDISAYAGITDELHEARRQLDTLLGNLPGMVYRANIVDKSFEFVSEGVREATGFRTDQIIGDGILTFLSRIDESDLPPNVARIKQVRLPHSTFAIRYRFKDPDERIRHLADRGRVVAWNPETGEPSVVEGFIFDVTDRENMIRALHESESRYRLLAESSEDVVTLLDMEGRLEYVSPSVERLTGYSADEIRGNHVVNFVFGEDRRRLEGSLAQLASGSETMVVEFRIVARNGEVVWIESQARAMRNEHDIPIGIVATSRNISARRRAEETIRWNAYHDALTGLPNRLLLEERATRLLSERENSDQSPAAIVFLDLDRFKQVNDTLGHVAGDQLLCELSRRIDSMLGTSDVVARMGGDEFIMLLADAHDLESVTSRVQSLLDTLRQPVRIDGTEMRVFACAGIAVYPQHGRDVVSLMKSADIALYAAKARGRGLLEFYRPNMNIAVEERIALESDLLQAVEKGEFTQYFAPQFDTESGQIVQLSGQLHWQHPLRGLLEPPDFVPIAEECNRIVGIEEWAIRNAVANGAHWQSVAPGVRVSVRISATQLIRADFPAFLGGVLADTTLRPELLVLEIPERVLERYTEVEPILCELRAMGVQLAIVQFGAETASFAPLRRARVEEIHIDPSLVQSMGEVDVDFVTVKCLIQMATALDLAVVAEGVETAEQMEMLTALHCTRMQGAYFAPPMSVDLVEKYLADSSANGMPD